LNESRAGVVIVVPTTAVRRGLSSHIEIEPGTAGLDELSYAKSEEVKSVSEQSAGKAVTRLGGCRSGDAVSPRGGHGAPSQLGRERSSGRRARPH
jgi:mRNA-degrading endonuclease toxin of MazEF toxin-antitoxin module